MFGGAVILLNGLLNSLFHGATVGSTISMVLDIFIVTLLFYYVFMVMQGTRAVQLIKGLLVLVAALSLSGWLQLDALGWLLSQLWSVIILALAVIFQPEIRRALEQIGRSRLYIRPFDAPHTDMKPVHDAVIKAAIEESKHNVGMLVVLEREIGLNNYIENGIQMDCLVSEHALINIFVPNTPLHDGAAIIRGNRIAAAACFLPLSDNPNLSMSFGTRHRSGIGLSEVSDALVVIVSEETGAISVAVDGRIYVNLDELTLRQHIEQHFGARNKGTKQIQARFRRKRERGAQE
ncbi:MAG: diadenylate cyclase CdaA [Firmicutes bacterium]|nr:diadenylate cyclase CdaA [Bacillota bacterium]MBQ3199889.1 diadenylate cyclase CdaA [Bacillota bacterium]